MQSLGTEAISTDPDVTEITVAQLYSVCELKEEGTTKYMRREQANRGSRSLDKGTPALVIPIHLCINQTSQQMLSELMYKNEPTSHCVVLIGHFAAIV